MRPTNEAHQRIHHDAPSTPTRKRKSPPKEAQHTPTLVTPSKVNQDNTENSDKNKLVTRRQLSLNNLEGRDASEELVLSSDSERSYFGRSSGSGTLQKNTRQVYALVNKMTGSIGGNGHGGAIYGELTIGSMQKMIDLMKIHTNFGPKSRFIDVGSGLGKPNLHVAQDPGVEFSYGIEMEHVRWMLGMSNLKTVLELSHDQEKSTKILTTPEKVHHRCIFAHGDITEAQCFDPFTHVYMFDIGFPPKLFKQLGEMFNRSQSEYLICYHGPKLMIEKYGFAVELIVQAPTSMHGSCEGHMGYIYRRSNGKQRPHKDAIIVNGIPCDPIFKSAWDMMDQDVKSMLDHVKGQVLNSLNSQRPKRRCSSASRV